MAVSKVDFSQQSSVNSAYQRMTSDNSFTIGAAVDFSAISNPNFEESTFMPGDVFQVPDGEAFDKYKFSQTLPNSTRPANGVLVQVIAGPSIGQTKRYYFSSARKRVIVYDENTLKPVLVNGAPKVIASNNDLAKASTVAGTVGEMADLVKGKVFRVDEVAGSPCSQAVFTDRKVSGTRTTHVYNMTEISEQELANM